MLQIGSFQYKIICFILQLCLVLLFGISCQIPSLTKSPLELLSALRFIQNPRSATNSTTCTENCESSTQGSSSNLISYAGSPYNLTTGSTAVNDTPSTTGSPNYFTVSPSLPFGLRLNPSTGAITGKISEAITNVDYVITAQSSNGSATTTIRISSTIPAPCPDVTITSGTGTAIDPYLICNPDQLQSMSIHHITNPGAYYRLTQDIDLSSIANFIPISNITNQFTGKFDGQDYTIHNLTIDDTATSQRGLFGYVIGGALTEIKNLRLSNANVRGNAQSGSVFGLINAIARNVHSINAVVVGFADGTGGIAGRLSSTGSIFDSSFSGTVTGTGLYTGGIIGDSFGGDQIFRCKASGMISGSDGVGGIIGRAADTPVQDSYWIGTVSGNNEVGGLIGKGQLSDGVPIYSYSVGPVTGASARGGASGSLTGVAVESYYNKDVATLTDNDTRGTPKTTSQLKCPIIQNDACAGGSIYSAWSSTYWDFGTSLDYPKLQWENSF
ncbi:MAG: hypothetical protein O9264_17090 [Leptospira sp.]|nr:hypothetical protein [Leptospira sp.]